MMPSRLGAKLVYSLANYPGSQKRVTKKTFPSPGQKARLKSCPGWAWPLRQRLTGRREIWAAARSRWAGWLTLRALVVASEQRQPGPQLIRRVNSCDERLGRQLRHEADQRCYTWASLTSCRRRIQFRSFSLELPNGIGVCRLYL